MDIKQSKIRLETTRIALAQKAHDEWAAIRSKLEVELEAVRYSGTMWDSCITKSLKQAIKRIRESQREELEKIKVAKEKIALIETS